MRPPGHPERADVRRTAADFLARREAGWAETDAVACARWRAASPEHAAAMDEIEAAHSRLQLLATMRNAPDLAAEAGALVGRRSRARFPGWARVAVPVALAAALMVAFAWRRPHPVDAGMVAASEIRTVDLSDGSTLRMYSGSAVDVQFYPGERRIALQRGAVHFAVAKDAARPFVVAAGNVAVRAVGTAFDVNSTPDAVEVLVTEGKVSVSRLDATQADPLYLVAGERTSLSRRAPAVVAAPGSVPASVAEVEPATRAPRLEFSDTPLSAVVARFNRYSRTQLEIGDADLASRPVGGTFDADRADVFVDLLATAGDVRIERVSETHVVLRRAR